MDLENRILQDIKEAMKKGSKTTVQVLRDLMAQVKDEKIKVRPREIKEEEVITVIQRAIKRRREAIEMYRQGNRQDLVDRENEEIKIIEKYLPEQLSHEEIKKLITDTIDQVGATSIKDLGRVMGTIMPKIKGRADGKVVQEMVRERLTHFDA